MKAGVVVFPGSNCDQDLVDVLKSYPGVDVVNLWHKNTNLENCTHIFLPGGFSYGDYLRSGAIANHANIMASIKQHAANGGFVMGICNGFQILCESGLLPGALLRNTHVKFSCKNVFLKTTNNQTAVTHELQNEQVIKIPIAHGEGRFYADEKTIHELAANKQVVFTYCDENGNITENSNPNGSTNNIAGICNNTFNVFGMMPHPERCANDDLGNVDGRMLFNSIFQGSLVA